MSRGLPRAKLRRVLAYCTVMLVTAAATASLCAAICWNTTARSLAREGYIRAMAMVGRPSSQPLGFEPFLEFRSAPVVDRPVLDPENTAYLVRGGLEVKPHAVGLTYPINMAFVPDGTTDDEPFYYVAELHGAIKWVDRKGRVHLLAEGLVNFPPVPKRTTDEFGISGLALIPGARDLLFTSPRRDEATGQFRNCIRRLYTQDRGRKLDRIETLLVLDGEPTSPSNQIQQIRFGPDGKLYVSVGDAMNWALSRDATKWGGKILRMNADGTPCRDNPFYSEEARSKSQNYVYALGLRNSFDFAFEPDSPRIWAGDVGQDLNRLVALARGSDLGWDGTDDSFCREVRQLFHDRFIPVGILFADEHVLGKELSGSLLLAGYGTFNGTGHGRSKRIVAFEVRDGRLASGPTGIVAYRGQNQSSILGLAQGPDGLYFTDPFGEQESGQAAGCGRVMKLSVSSRTAMLPVDDKPAEWKTWSSVERGRYLFVNAGSCGACHTVDRLSTGQEGPNLSLAIPELRRRLQSNSYWEDLARGATGRPGGHQDAINEVQAATGAQRVRKWLRHHILDPRFDNPRGKMPGFGKAKVFDDQELESLLDFVLSLE